MTDDISDDSREAPASDPFPAARRGTRASRAWQAGISEAELNAMLSDAVVGLMNVRRGLDPLSFEALLGAVAVEIEIGMDLARERAMETTHRRRRDGNVVWLGRPSSGIDHD